MPTAFVLSGGASLGSIQVGMLEALYEREIRPDLIVGTSVGALNGAFIAERPQTVDTALELGEVWRGLKRGQVFPVNPLTGALGFMGARSHLVPDSGLRRLIRRHAVAERLEETYVPLHVIATDVLRGEDVRLSEGPLLDAVMASAAIPGVLPAVDWDGRTLIDGGVANNAPISHALELGADEVYVLATGAPCELHEPPRGALAMLVYATGLLVGRRLAYELAALDGRAGITVLPPPCPLSVQPTDFGHADLLIAQARADARELLDRRERSRDRRTRRVAPLAADAGAAAGRRRRGPSCRPSAGTR
jgi:NTE family protein